ncbi:hypothetical protein MTR67_021515 [Solanum verrucosum]|uniref:Uncharacterized protein n=1 Tax=Solanum verrucosum TaxID=315347 RepID=A0AAF0QT11_SOLVR|nr:hypothetical protein MTR67_021515 [Solanum verrucosum]
MNYKAFTLILFVLIFCLSSTMASRRILSDPGGSKMPSRSHQPKADGSATTQPPPGKNQRLYSTAKSCNYYSRCKRATPTVTPCNFGNRCKRNNSTLN